MNEKVGKWKGKLKNARKRNVIKLYKVGKGFVWDKGRKEYIEEKLVKKYSIVIKEV